MYELKEKLESYLRVNLLGPGPRLTKKEFTGPSSYKKRIYRAAVSQRLRNTGLQALRGNILHRVTKKNWSRKM